MTATGPQARPELWLVRHGETSWSRLGRHTSRTEIPLTAAGRREARLLGRSLRGIVFTRVRTSPSVRATETARLAGVGEVAEPTADLLEWDYGEFEGATTPDIRRTVPGWTIWAAGAPAGESPDAVARRVDRVIHEARAATGATLLIAHAHVLRVLTARWLGLPPADGRLFVLGTGTISVLGWEREQPAILRWNERCAPGRERPIGDGRRGTRRPGDAPGQRTTRTEQGAS
jgi:probable phosphoglycerate mutase